MRNENFIVFTVFFDFKKNEVVSLTNITKKMFIIHTYFDIDFDPNIETN